MSVCAQRNVEGIRVHIPARLCWCGDAKQLRAELTGPHTVQEPAHASGPKNITWFDTTWLQIFKIVMFGSLFRIALFRTLNFIFFLNLHWRISYIKISVNG